MSKLSILLTIIIVLGCAGTKAVFAFEETPPITPSTTGSGQDLKEKFKTNADALVNLSGRVAHLEASQFEDPGQRRAVVADVQNSIRVLAYVQRQISVKKLQFSDEVLSQFNGLAVVLSSILNKLSEPGTKLNSADVQRIKIIGKDIQLKSKNINDIKGYSPDEQAERYPQYLVTVKTLKSKDNEEKDLTVYYCPQAVFGTSSEKESTRSFKSLSSPAKQELPEADYFIWACRGNDLTRATQVKDLAVRKPSSVDDNTVELLIDK